MDTAAFLLNDTLARFQELQKEQELEPLNLLAYRPIAYTVPLHGYVGPASTVVTIVFNTIIVLVLAQSKMISPTYLILIAMAVSDMLTGLVPLPWMVHFYLFQKYYFYGVQNIPTIFHTASIWLITFLAIQRYIFVCYSKTIRNRFTMRNTLYCIAFIYVLAITYNLPRFFEINIGEVEVVWHLAEKKGEVVKHCGTSVAKWLIGNEDIFFNTYYLFRVIFVHIVPCSILIVLNALLVKSMHEAVQKRKILFNKNSRHHSAKSDSYATTIMLIVVVFVFLLVEIPLGVIFILHIIQNAFGVHILPLTILSLLSVVIDTMILLSYPLNFIIYCFMSRIFRQRFVNLFLSRQKKKCEKTQLLTLDVKTQTNDTSYV